MQQDEISQAIQGSAAELIEYLDLDSTETHERQIPTISRVPQPQQSALI